MKQEYSAGVIVFYKKGKNEVEFLLLHYTAGHWDFPKGHIEKGETKEQTALRELQEETSLTAHLLSHFEEIFSYFFHDYKTKELIHKTVYFFLGKATTKEVHLSYEHKGFVWLPYREALERLTYKNAQLVLQRAERYIKQL